MHFVIQSTIDRRQVFKECQDRRTLSTEFLCILVDATLLQYRCQYILEHSNVELHSLGRNIGRNILHYLII